MMDQPSLRGDNIFDGCVFLSFSVARYVLSYAVAIVVPPVSSKDKEAWKQLDVLTEQEGPAPDVFLDLHDRLTARFPCLSSLSDDEIDDGVWSDGPLWNNFGNKAAVLGMVYSRVAEVLPFLIESANSLGLVVFDWTSGAIHRGDGLKGLVLTVENEISVPWPRLEQVYQAIDRLTAKGGPGFMILEGPGEDYVQVAGGDRVYTLEWREHSGDGFRHWVAGILGAPGDADVIIRTNEFHVTVKKNERLNSTEVKTILKAYTERAGRPAGFAWRDVTERFN